MKLILFLLFLFVSTALSQLKEGEVVDKIVAVVGNEIILLSDLQAQAMIFAQQDPSINPEDPNFKKRILDAMINEKLIITKAIEDSIVVTDEEIKQGWELYLSRLVQYYGSEKRIEDIYQMSVQRMEYEYRDEIRKQLLSQKIKQQKFGEIKVSQREVEEFFQQYKDSLQKIPTQVELYHIVKFVEASPKAREEVLALANRVRDSIINGRDFTEMVKNHSADPGTSASGGNLDWRAKGQLIPEFEKAAFQLQQGETSVPIETPFGFHLIQTLGKTKDSLHTRHILFKIGQSNDEIDSAKRYLLAIKHRAEKGENFEDLARQFSDEKETKGFGGYIGKFPINQVPAGVKEIVEKLKDGGISEPYPFSVKPKQSFHIVYKKSTIPEHTATLQNDYKEIEQMATVYKQNKMYMEWVESLRKELYWEIKN